MRNMNILIGNRATLHHLLTLKTSEASGYYFRTLLLAQLTQACLLYGTSGTAKRFVKGLPYLLLGILWRYLELSRLPCQHQRVLADCRRYDQRNSQQLRARERLCQRIRDIEENLLAKRGLTRFLAMASPVRSSLTCLTTGIIRYCGRLTGRTATEYGHDIICRIPEMIGYVEMLDNVAAAWQRNQKNPLFVVAEEYQRIHTEKHFRISGEVLKRNENALKDLMKIVGIVQLDNFQDSGSPVFNMPGQNLLVRCETSSTPVKEPSHRKSRRMTRRTRHVRRKSNSRASSRITSKEKATGGAVQKKTSGVWMCYKLRKK